MRKAKKPLYRSEQRTFEEFSTDRSDFELNIKFVSFKIREDKIIVVIQSQTNIAGQRAVQRELSQGDILQHRISLDYL